ncbi:hypothetical protein DRQ15_00365 [candidate division KSB1 bacterium]|nr:MAG: hypothetical protein DRQ15_00365 [candidate division KSB1 bacterium]
MLTRLSFWKKGELYNKDSMRNLFSSRDRTKDFTNFNFIYRRWREAPMSDSSNFINTDFAKIKKLEEKPHKYEQELQRTRNLQERLRALVTVIRNITEELYLEPLLWRIMDEVKRILKADRCTVFLLDEEKKELWSKVAHGIEGYEIRFPLSKGIAGYVAKTGEVLNISNCYQDPRFNPEIDRKTGYRTRNILCVPMRNKLGEVVGVFQVLNKLDGAFTDDDVEMLLLISTIAASQIENAQLYEEQRKTFNSLIETLASTIDARDPLTAGHSRRIMLYADEIAKLANFSIEEREILRTAALLHDIGKIGVRESILTKKSKLTPSEYEHIKSHVVYTRAILKKIHFSWKFRQVPQIASSHHEKMNGSGYPEGLKGDAIPVGGRILAIADLFDALTSKRHYADRMKFEKVVQILEQGADLEYDAELIEAFKRIPLDRLVLILEDENSQHLSQDDLHFLSHYTLNDLVQTLQNSNFPKDQLFVQTFMKYYFRQY